MQSENGERPFLLVVDDHRSVRELIASTISAGLPHYQVMTVDSGEEAVDAVSRGLVAAVVMDIGLPGISGIEATRRIKSLHPQTSVVMLSIHEEDQYAIDSKNAGAAAYVTKRTMGRDLLPTLERVLLSESSGRQHDNYEPILPGGNEWSG